MAQDAPQPATVPAGPAAFQPGVWIDWQRREVHVQTRVVLRAGPLEFLACWPGKEHESILRFEPAAEHVYIALGLIGLLPGHPPVWQPNSGAYAAPAGDLLDIRLQWQAGDELRTADAYEWLREVEYGRRPISRPWIFAGSIRLPDGTLAAGRSGVGIALVDFSDSLICYSRRYPSRYGELWAEANSQAIPPVGTAVRLILRPARPKPHWVTIDFRGVPWVDGRYSSLEDLADLIGLTRRLDPGYIQTVSLAGCLQADLLRIRRHLAEQGVPEDALRFVAAAATMPTAPPR